MDWKRASFSPYRLSEMKTPSTFCLVLTTATLVYASQTPLSEPELLQTWSEKYGPQTDQGFSGPLSFSHLPYSRCLEDAADLRQFDVALLGMPFDTGTSYRPGARFGPYAIRSGSRRQRETRGYTLTWKKNPYRAGIDIVDCGDVHLLHRLHWTCLVGLTDLSRFL